jgi:hypothetical protein
MEARRYCNRFFANAGNFPNREGIQIHGFFGRFSRNGQRFADRPKTSEIGRAIPLSRSTFHSNPTFTFLFSFKACLHFPRPRHTTCAHEKN